MGEDILKVIENSKQSGIKLEDVIGKFKSINEEEIECEVSLLEKEGIGYRTKVRDLSSPSLFSMGTRERTGTTFQKVNCQTIYTIYVRKVDYERAVHVIIV